MIIHTNDVMSQFMGLALSALVVGGIAAAAALLVSPNVNHQAWARYIVSFTFGSLFTTLLIIVILLAAQEPNSSPTQSSSNVNPNFASTGTSLKYTQEALHGTETEVYRPTSPIAATPFTENDIATAVQSSLTALTNVPNNN